MEHCRVFVFYVEAMRIVLGATAPGLGWETALERAVRAFYADAVQGRWVRVVAMDRVERNRRFERWSVLTSRDEVLSVVVRELAPAEEPDDEDPPEVLATLEQRATAMAILEQALAESHLRKVAAGA